MQAPISVRSEFRDGSIARIRCHQFLTYREVTITPGPRLNVVVGPNGTGKSSIVCAIAIGLGAPTKLLGRSDNLGEFVMQGCEDGFVEIELFRQGRPNQVIKRCLHAKSETSKWFLDGKPSNQKAVLDVVARTGAQIANLCTFLPQEKVGEFSGFDSVQLLQETEKAVGGPDLFDDHRKLVAEEKEGGELERQLESKKARVEELKDQNRVLERDREKMEEREAFLLKAALCKQRLLWVTFNEAQSEALQLKADKDASEEAVRSAQNNLEPLKEQLRQANVLVAKLEKVADDARKELDPAAKRQKACLEKAAKELEAVADARNQVENISTRAAEAAKKVDKYTGQLKEATARLEAYDAEAVKAAVAQLKEELAEHTEAFNRADGEREGLADAAKRARRELDKAERDLGQLGDSSGARKEHLAQVGGPMAKESLRLRDFVDKNRGSFRLPVHGPTALEVNVRDASYVDALENQIKAGQLFGFVTECEEDYRKLRDHVNKSRLNVTVYNIEGGKCKPSDGRGGLHPQALADLKARGMECFLDEQVDCPDAVRQMLRDHAKLDKVVVGGAALQDEFNRDSDGVTRMLLSSGGGGGGSYTMYTRNPSGGNDGVFTLSSGKKSKYQDRAVLTVASVRQARGVVQVGEDPSIRAGLEAACDRARAVSDKHGATLEAALRGFEKLKKARDQAEQRYVAKRQDLTMEKKLSSDIAMLGKKLAAAQDEQKGLDVAKERKVLLKRLSLAVNKRLDYLERAQVESAALLDLEVRLGGARLGLEMGKDLEAERRKAVRHEEEQFEALNKRAADAKAKFKDCKEKLRQVKKDAEEGAPILADDGAGGKAETPLKAALDQLPLSRAEVVAIHDVNEMAAAAIHHNPAVILQYNARKVEIEALEQAIADLAGQGGGRASAFLAAKAKWVTQIEQMVCKLDALFTNYMGQLNNAGKVEVHRDPHSLDKWGINLLVSFRQGQGLVPLSKKVQSGGERSVSTIMFLMALQDMVKSPFRVVDEINQGMDERNERIVFRRIVENSVGAARPQYFLITPKLLQGLTAMEHEDVTVLFVFNGPFCLEDPKQWDLDKFLARAKTAPADALKRRRVVELQAEED